MSRAQIARSSVSPQVCVVEASAGSGKTYALAKRYIKLLINPLLGPDAIPLQAILAITFTNKAAIEMKERIMEFLKKIALDAFSSRAEKEDILSSLGVEEAFARRKAGAIMDYVIRNYNFFQVQTIDSFINTILSGCAFKLDLSSAFKTKENYRDYLSFSLDRLIDKAACDKEVLGLFSGFITQYLFIENKAGWFPKQNILKALDSLFLKSNQYALEFAPSKTQAADLISQKKRILKLMRALREGLPEGVHKAFRNNLDYFLERNAETFGIERVSDFFKRDALPVNKGVLIPPEAQKLWCKIRGALTELCEQESASMFNYYVGIFNQVASDLKAVSRKDDVLFLEGLNKQARSLFDEKSLGLPELYYRLACRFSHFLIDEFQDTSGLQWGNLSLMVEEALSTGGSLFYVGDRKQAIYRFRGGSISLMDALKKQYRDFNLTEEPLAVNYRSQKEIVEFNNTVFSEDNLKEFLGRKEEKGTSGFALSDDDTQEIVGVFKDSRQSFKKGNDAGYVSVTPIYAGSREERNRLLKEALYRLIGELRARFPLKEVALLARKNDQVQLLTSWLLEKAIPAESEKTLDIRQNSFIKELVSLLTFLNSPIDNLAFASFILGDIFLAGAGLTREAVQEFILDFKEKGRDASYMYREFRARYASVWEGYLEEFFRSVGFVPLYELVISVLGKFSVLHRFPGYQGFFMKFLELIKAQEEENASISLFLEFFEKAPSDELYVNAAESDSVKILTIHKAKGLEFPVVIIPFLEMELKLEQEVVIADEASLKLVYVKKKYAQFSPSLSAISAREYVKSLIDELNGIYVAFTRAKEELYIFSSPGSHKGAGLASLLLPQEPLESGSKREFKGARSPERAIVAIAPSEYKDWIHLLRDEFIDEHLLESRDKIVRGEVLHFALSRIGNLHGQKQDKDFLLRQALELARCRFPAIRDFDGLEPLLRNLLERPELERYFDVAEGFVFTEKEIVDAFGNTHRIDRLIVNAQEAVIIDYKSAREKDAPYREQVVEYMRSVKEVYPDKAIRGILMYLDDASTEEVNGTGNLL